MRRAFWAVFVVFGMAVSVACGADAPDEGAASQETERHNTVVRIDAASRSIAQELTVGSDPLEVRVSAGQVWVQTFGDGSLTRIDPADNTTHDVNLTDVAGFGVDGGDVWVAHAGRKLTVLDGRTGNAKRSVDVAPEPIFAAGNAGFLTVGGGAVWLTVPKLGDDAAPQEVWRIDPASGAVEAKVPIGPEPVPPFYDGRFIWIITPDDLYRVDPTSNEVRKIDVANGPFGIASGAESLWVGHASPTAVWRIDPNSGNRTAEIPVGEEVRGLAFGGGRLWVTTGTGVVSIDPANDQVGPKIELAPASSDEGPTGIVYLDGALWVSIE